MTIDENKENSTAVTKSKVTSKNIQGKSNVRNKETIGTMSMDATDEFNEGRIHYDADESAVDIQIYNANSDGMESIPSSQSYATTNRNGIRSSVLKGGNKVGENDDSSHVKKEHNIRPKGTKTDDDIPLVLVEANRMLDNSIQKIVSVGTDRTSKQNKDTKEDNSNGKMNIPKKSSIAPNIEQPTTAMFKLTHKTIGKTFSAMRLNGRKVVQCLICQYVSDVKNFSRHMRSVWKKIHASR